MKTLLYKLVCMNMPIDTVLEFRFKYVRVYDINARASSRCLRST